MRNLGWKGLPSVPLLRRCRSAGRPARNLQINNDPLDGIVPAHKSDLRWQLPDVFNQGEIGSCTAQSVAANIYSAAVRQHLENIPLPSRLFLYYEARRYFREQLEDCGSNLCTVFDVAARLGWPAEILWPYNTAWWASHPSQDAIRDAFDRSANGDPHTHYHQLDGTGNRLHEQIRQCLTAGMTVSFGTYVSREFCSVDPRVVVDPTIGDNEGGHAMLICGHDDAQECYFVRNSWGKDWGDPAVGPGNFRMSYRTVLHPGFGDCWTCTLVQS